jgi:DNA polymerase III subunit delta'
LGTYDGADMSPADLSDPDGELLLDALPGLESHPHARAVLTPVLAQGGAPSHAYLFHGPAGTGKRMVARAFAAALLADGARNPATVAERVARESHPDLTWVRPSGAAEMLVADIEEPVVAAATRTPFESSRRVFVIEGADTLNDQAANRLLKTLEEPPAFTHVLLLADHREDVLATVASRCQLVRFDPLPPARIAARLRTEPGGVSAGAANASSPEGDEDMEGDRVLACARLAMGDAGVAARLASEEGEVLRARAEELVRWAMSAGGTGAEGSAGDGELADGRPWVGLLDLARAAGAAAGARAQEAMREELELLPSKERKRYEREGAEAQRRGERRVRTRTLDEGLRVAELCLRDLLCVREGAPELVYAVDRREQLERDAAGRQAAVLQRGIELVADTRLSLSANVSEELALEALAYRLQALLAGDALVAH